VAPVPGQLAFRFALDDASARVQEVTEHVDVSELVAGDAEVLKVARCQSENLELFDDLAVDEAKTSGSSFG
jgi:hypothetical protein